MIEKLIITNPANTVCPWWEKIEAFKGRKEFSFTPGLNILWGKNGSGKSSVVQMLARLTHSAQGGVSLVTEESMRHFRDFHNPFRDGQDLVTDGRGVWYCDPSERVGLIGGGFDYDFMDMGLQNTMFKGSHGETTLMRVFSILKDMRDQKQPTLAYKYKRQKPDGKEKNPHYAQQNQEQYDTFLKATKYLQESGEKGKPTVIFDEPDRSLDIPTQLRFWDTILGRSDKYQIIVASHSMFAMDLPGANYIELVPGYLDSCRTARSVMMRYAAMAERVNALPVAAPAPVTTALPQPTPRKPRKKKETS